LARNEKTAEVLIEAGKKRLANCWKCRGGQDKMRDGLFETSRSTGDFFEKAGMRN